MNDSNLEKGAPYRFKPGVSGNPGGRPKKRPISDRYLEFAKQKLPGEYRVKRGLPEGATYGDALVEVTFRAALEGNIGAVREIREAIEGKTGLRQNTNFTEGDDPEISKVFDELLGSRDGDGAS